VSRPRLLVGSALLAALTLSACSGTDPDRGGDAAATGTTSAGGVTERRLDLRDPSRDTDPTPESAGDDAVAGRDLPTTLWYPEGAGPFPVVVFSHGLGSTPDAYAHLLAAWAAAGALVVAPTFPLTSEGSALVAEDVANQPADVSFVLDQVLALDTADDELAGRIDAAHLAVAGHSAGAITTLGLLDACCREPRATAALVLSGALELFAPTAAVPTLFLHGSADEVLPLSGGQDAYLAAPGPKAFVELSGATHSAPYDDPSDRYAGAVESVTTDFLRWSLADDPQALVALRTDAAQQGTTDLVDDQLTP
jgi:predicted dienelactone hydrolase